MTTLRRELRLKFESVLRTTFNTAHVNETVRELLCNLLADAALEVRGFQSFEGDTMFTTRINIDESKLPLEWKILAGAEIKQETVDAAVLEKETIDAFESAFSIKGNWNWYPAKPQEMRVWEDFRARLIKIYQADKDAFTKYVTWIAQPYSRGAMTGLQIKRNPQDFPDAWASFCMGTGYKPPRQIVPDSERTDLDEGGAPISYM